jgi:hypothetical protein
MLTPSTPKEPEDMHDWEARDEAGMPQAQVADAAKDEDAPPEGAETEEL